MTAFQWKLLPKQRLIVDDWNSPNVIYRGALGAGKNYCGARWIISRVLRGPIGSKGLVVAPTFSLAKSVNMEDIKAALDEAGINYQQNASPLDMNLRFAGRKIQFLSGDKPESIVAHTVTCVWHDEPGIQSVETHRNINARVRDPRVQMLYHLKTGTPEGLGWYHQLEKEEDDGVLRWKVVTATLFDNKKLKEQYIRGQVATWRGSPMFKSYILGEATAVSGSVFSSFSREKLCRKLDPLIGEIVTAWDFNVHHQTTVCGTIHPGPRIQVWGEVVTKSPAHIPTSDHAARVVEYLKRRAGCFKGADGLLYDSHGNAVGAVIDASGDSERTSAFQTDKRHLEDAGFTILNRKKKNPGIHDSVANVDHYHRHTLILYDADGATQTVDAVQAHPYEKDSDPPLPKKWSAGEPGLQCDHFTDCIRYLCWHVGVLGQRAAFRWLS